MESICSIYDEYISIARLYELSVTSVGDICFLQFFSVEDSGKNRMLCYINKYTSKSWLILLKIECTKNFDFGKIPLEKSRNVRSKQITKVISVTYGWWIICFHNSAEPRLINDRFVWRVLKQQRQWVGVEKKRKKRIEEKRNQITFWTFQCGKNLLARISEW